MVKQVGAVVLTPEEAEGRVSGSSSFSAAECPHLHTSCNAMQLLLLLLLNLLMLEWMCKHAQPGFVGA